MARCCEPPSRAAAAGGALLPPVRIDEKTRREEGSSEPVDEPAPGWQLLLLLMTPESSEPTRREEQGARARALGSWLIAADVLWGSPRLANLIMRGGTCFGLGMRYLQNPGFRSLVCKTPVSDSPHCKTPVSKLSFAKPRFQVLAFAKPRFQRTGFAKPRFQTRRTKPRFRARPGFCKSRLGFCNESCRLARGVQIFRQRGTNFPPRSYLNCCCKTPVSLPRSAPREDYVRG